MKRTLVALSLFLLFSLTVMPSHPTVVSAGQAICGNWGWDFTPSGLGFTILIDCSSNELFLWQPSEGLMGYFRINDPVVVPTNLQVSRGTVTKKIVSWSSYQHIAGCHECLAAPPPTSTSSAVPTRISRPVVKLAITALEIEPDPPTEFERIKLQVIVENQGTQRLDTFWDYTGQVVLKKPGGGRIEEPHDFAKDMMSSFINPVINNPADLHGPQRWRITIHTYFWHPSKDAKLEVSVQPKDRTILPVIASRSVSIQPNPNELGRCATFVVRTIASALGPGAVKTFLDRFVAGGTLATCKSIRCYIKAIVTLVLKSIHDVGKIIAAIAGIFNAEGAKECAVRWTWATEMVKEFIHHGIPINLFGVHSPALILVANQAGQRAGFLDDGTIVDEIPGSRVVVEREAKFVLYPADPNTTTRLKATADGRVTVTLILSGGANGAQEIIYTDVPVTARTVAQVKSSDAQHILKIDSDGDGRMEQLRLPDRVETISVGPTGGAPPSSGGTTGGISIGPATGAGGHRTRISGSNPAPVILLLVLILGIGTAFGATLLIRRQSRVLPVASPGVLRVYSSGQPTRTIPIQHLPFTIGRGSGCDLVLPDPQVSRLHARISLRGNALVLEDLGSTNGTFVNGQQTQRAILRPGDRIRIGQTEIVLARITAHPAQRQQ